MPPLVPTVDVGEGPRARELADPIDSPKRWRSDAVAEVRPPRRTSRAYEDRIDKTVDGVRRAPRRLRHRRSVSRSTRRSRRRHRRVAKARGVDRAETPRPNRIEVPGRDRAPGDGHPRLRRPIGRRVWFGLRGLSVKAIAPRGSGRRHGEIVGITGNNASSAMRDSARPRRPQGSGRGPAEGRWLFQQQRPWTSGSSTSDAAEAALVLLEAERVDRRNEAPAARRPTSPSSGGTSKTSRPGRERDRTLEEGFAEGPEGENVIVDTLPLPPRSPDGMAPSRTTRTRGVVGAQPIVEWSTRRRADLSQAGLRSVRSPSSTTVRACWRAPPARPTTSRLTDITDRTEARLRRRDRRRSPESGNRSTETSSSRAAGTLQGQRRCAHGRDPEEPQRASKV